MATSAGVRDIEKRALLEESSQGVGRIQQLYDTYIMHSLKKAELLKRLQQSLPIDGKARERITKVDFARKKLFACRNSRELVETNIEKSIRELSMKERDLSMKKGKIETDRENLERARKELEEAKDNMYNTTFNHLSIAQQNLTFRRWELAKGVAHIFSLSSIEALRTPPTSPMRDSSLSPMHRGNSSDNLPMQRGRNISICGLELDSSVIKKNKDTMLDQENENNAEKLATALGYVAHILQLLSTYFDIPLRYPVKPVNSRSYICDVLPGKPNAKSKQQNAPETIKFPLYIDHVGVERERTRFAYAVFLLNKDIEQILNAHGLDAYGVAPHFTLSNLHKFLSYSN